MHETSSSFVIYFETFEFLEFFCWPEGPCATYQWHILSIEISGFEKVKSNHQFECGDTASLANGNAKKCKDLKRQYN
jgi:hypothetical protein